jgi:serine/threonine protein kinase
VYVAEDPELHRQVALKEIQDKHAADPESRSRFVLEAEITGGLEHPGIVPVYGLGTYADGRPYYAMRFIQGDSLKDAIERFHAADTTNRDPGERALELRKLLGRFIDVCEAIQYAHDRGILHRDLKPGNIMLGKYGETLVVDWGLAKPMGQLEHPSTEPMLKPASASGSSETLPGKALGTPQYMSPEQAAGRLEEVTTASDVYSLGATLYALLTGRASVEDSAVEVQRQADLGKLFDKVINGRIRGPRQIKANVDPALDAICMKAMALKPANRYRSPRDLAGDLEHWLADEPVTAWAEPASVKVRRWIGKNRTLVTGVTAALLVGVISLTATTILLADKNKDLFNANVAIEAESTEREKQRLIAVAAQKKAEERLDQSVATLKLFANDARAYCEDAVVPGESKKQLFEVLLNQLEGLAGEEDKEFNEDKLRARIFLYETVALTQIELARSKDALGVLGKALKLADHWLTVKPNDPGALGRRAAVIHLFGEVHRRLLNDKLAVKYYNEAYEIRKKLLGNEKVERFTPGKTRSDLADSLDGLERWEEAIEARLEAHQFVLNHIAKHGEKSADRYFTLDGLNWTLQKAAERTPDYAKKKAYLDEANATSAELLKLRPTGRPALDRWAKNLKLYGDTERRQSDLAAKAGEADKAKSHLAEAQKQYAKYAEITRRLAVSKDLLDQRRRFADSWYELGRVVRAADQKKAEQHWKYCLSLREEIMRDYAYPVFVADEKVRLERLLVLAQLGKHDEVVPEAEMMHIKIGGKSVRFGLARVFALCSAAPAADKATKDRCRSKSLTCLTEAVAQGFDQWEEVHTEPDLAAIRDDPRYAKILQREKKPR